MSKAKLRAKGACKNYKICIIYGFKFEFFKFEGVKKRFPL